MVEQLKNARGRASHVMMYIHLFVGNNNSPVNNFETQRKIN